MNFTSTENTAAVIRATEILPHAEVVFIDELVEETEIIGKYIRVTGIVEFYDAASKTARLTEKDHYIILDMGLCNNTLTIGSMFQVFGEIFPSGTKVNLNAFFCFYITFS